MKIKIALLAGDGIGPEVIDQAVKVCDAVARKFNHEITWMPALTGAAAIDAVGDPYPDATHEICLQADAVLFGAIGHPKYDNDPGAKVRPEQGLLKMRKKLGLFANIRPTYTFPSLIGMNLISLFNRPFFKLLIPIINLIFYKLELRVLRKAKENNKNLSNVVTFAVKGNK